jgi:hypothetical protein
MKKHIGILVLLIHCGISLTAMEHDTGGIINVPKALSGHDLKSLIKQGNLKAFKTCNLSQLAYSDVVDLMNTTKIRSKSLAWAKELCGDATLFNMTIAELEATAKERYSQAPMHSIGMKSYVLQYIQDELNKSHSSKKGAVLAIIGKSISLHSLYYHDLIAVMQQVENKGDMHNKVSYVNEQSAIIETMKTMLRQEQDAYGIMCFPATGYTIAKPSK